MGKVIHVDFRDSDEWSLGDEIEIPGWSDVWIVAGFTRDGDPILAVKPNLDDGPTAS